MVLLGIKKAYDRHMESISRQAAKISIPRLLKLCDNCWCCCNGKCCWHSAMAGFLLHSDERYSSPLELLLVFNILVGPKQTRRKMCLGSFGNSKHQHGLSEHRLSTEQDRSNQKPMLLQDTVSPVAGHHSRFVKLPAKDPLFQKVTEISSAQLCIIGNLYYPTHLELDLSRMAQEICKQVPVDSNIFIVEGCGDAFHEACLYSTTHTSVSHPS
jgi:hypothetical protein